MKTNFIHHITLSVCLVLAAFAVLSCSSSDDDAENFIETEIKDAPFDVSEGDIAEIEFEVDGELMATYKTVIYNFGTEENPCLFPVKESYDVKDPMYQNIFKPLDKEVFIEFIKNIWIHFIESGNLEEQERIIKAFQFFKSYVTSRNVDPALIILLSGQQEASAVKAIIDQAFVETLTPSLSSSNSKVLNDLLSQLYIDEISPSKFLHISEETGLAPLELMQVAKEYKLDLASNNTRAVVKDIISIVVNGAKMVKAIFDLVANNKVLDVKSATASVLNSEDIDVNNYTNGTKKSSQKYKYKYKVWPFVNSELELRIDYEYNATHKTLPGKYIKAIYVNPLVAKTNTGKVICNVSYSNPINMNTTELPVAKMIGACSIQVGDCCCVQNFSYLNFNVYGDRDIEML